MYRHGSTAAALSPRPSAPSAQVSALPTYDPRSEISRKEAARLRSAEKMLHLIPVVIFLCVAILWFFSHPVSLEEINGVHEESIRTSIKNMSIDGYDALEATSGTIDMEALASVDDTGTEETARLLGNKGYKDGTEEETDDVVAGKEDEIDTDETDRGPDEEDGASKEDQGEDVDDEGDIIEYKETDTENDEGGRKPEGTGRVVESKENGISIEDSGRSMNGMEDRSNTKEAGEAEDNEKETKEYEIGSKLTGTDAEDDIADEETGGEVDYSADGITTEETVRSVDNRVHGVGTDPLRKDLDNEVDRMIRMNLARTCPHIKDPVRKERTGSDVENNEGIGLKETDRDVDNEEDDDDLEERCLTYKVNGFVI